MEGEHQGVTFIESRPMDAPDQVEWDVQLPDILKNSRLGLTTNPPIASVPPEVLGSILNFVYEESDSDGNKRPNSPIVFSHVCRFWRSVALDNSLWWTRIIVTPPWKLDEVKTLLDRSKERSLDLRIFVNIDLTTTERPIHSPPLDNYENLRNLISPHIHRCRIFRLQGYYDKSTQFLVPYLLESFRSIDTPLLEQFIVDGRLVFEHKIHVRKLFSSAPLLRDLRIGGHGLTSYLLPLSTITKLHIMLPGPSKGISPAQLNIIFNACACLTELALYDDTLDLEDIPLSPLFVFPSLLTLQLLAYITTVSEFLTLISSAPKLRRLVLVPVTDFDLKLLNQSMRHTFPFLTSIVLSPMDEECWDVIDYASTCFPDITHLILANVYPDEFEMYFLERTTPLFPCLLELALKGVDEVLGRVITDFVIFRHSKNVPLQTVFVDEASMRHLSPDSHLWGDTKIVGVDLIGPLGEDLTHAVRHKFVARY
jgi:hypothetical protein